MCIGESKIQTEMQSETFFGSIKSFNIRRGFGFLSCQETAQLYGRDVYLSKDEAMTLSKEPETGSDTIGIETALGKEKSKTGPVQEGDFLSFKVQLSAEGFPQAGQVQKIRRLSGVVSKPPSPTEDGIITVTGGEYPKDGSRNSHSDLEQVLGTYVKLPLSTCGQLQLVPNDEISLCCINTPEVEGHMLEVHRIDLLRTYRDAGSLLGCFSLKLPQSVSKNVTDADDAASTAASSDDSEDAEFHGYALADRVFVSGILSQSNTSDLMRFFGKMGGHAATVAPADGSIMSGFTCFAFSTIEQVAKLLSQALHTISDNGITQLAQLGPCPHRQCGGCCGLHACQASPSSLGINGSMGRNERALSTEPEMTQKASRIIGVPCAAIPCSPQLEQDARGQHTVNLPAPVQTPPISRKSMPEWRCIHSNIVLAPAAPEMMSIGGNSCSVCMQWPTVVHASAYSVELMDQCTGISQQFVRVTDAGCVPALTDLQIDGLQPSSYAARVRCIAPCGCESACSAWGTLPLACLPSCGLPASVSAVDVLLPPYPPAPIQALPANVCPPPPNAPPSLPFASVEATASPPPILKEVADEDLNFNDDEVLTLD